MKKLLCVFLITSIVFAATISIPNDHSSIQEGITASSNGDTVLVDNGIYYEQLNFNGKNIVLTSQYIFSHDTSDISNTIIDANNAGTAISMISDENDSTVLNGFTIQHSNTGAIFLIDSDPLLENLIVKNNSGFDYGAILVYYNSNPLIRDCVIKDNISTYETSQPSQIGGGGIFVKTNSNPIIENCVISNNTASHGGGIRVDDNSSPVIRNCTINNNESIYDGGGIYIRGASPEFRNISVENNVAGRDGGGLFCNEAETHLSSTHFELNSAESSGGGIYLWESDINLSGVLIDNNNAGDTRFCYGGGLFSDSSTVSFDPDTLCNMYNNLSYHADDMYSSTNIHVVLDTFTVKYPTGYQINPIENFTFSILNGKQEQIEQDIYVSPLGDNNNTGTSISSPFKTIEKALMSVYADSLNPRTIYLMEGTYSTISNSETFPIMGIDHVTLAGVDSQQTIIDANDNEYGFWFENLKGISLKNLKVKNAIHYNIYIRNASISIENVQSEQASLGCASSFSNIDIINCDFSHNNYSLTDYISSIVFENSVIKNNRWGIKLDKSDARIIDCKIHNNTNYGLYSVESDFTILNTVVSENHMAGILSLNSTGHLEDTDIKYNHCSGMEIHHSDLEFSGVSIHHNTGGGYGGGIRIEDSSSVAFDASNLCSIYSNEADVGKDLFSWNCDVIDVIMDTSSVATCTHYFATPVNKFTYQVNNGLIDQCRTDLYVSPFGSNGFTGLSPDQPLQTIDMALSKLIPDSSEIRRIFLAEGTYSESYNDDHIPVNIPGYISIIGPKQGIAVLDGENVNRCVNFQESHGSSLNRINIENASDQGIYVVHSDLDINKTNFLNNSQSFCSYFSKVKFNNTLISKNRHYGGISYFSDLDFINCTLADIGDTTYNWVENVSFYLFQTNVRILNSIYWNNGMMLFEQYNKPCDILVVNSNTQVSPYPFQIYGYFNALDVSNNLETEPNFVDPDNNDYRLVEGCLCINAGTDFYEINGDTLINLSDTMYIGPDPDMGAFESSVTDGLSDILPDEFKLGQNYPNPFNPRTSIDYQLPMDCRVNLSLFDVMGRKIRELINDDQHAGYYSIDIDASDLSTGMYIYRLETEQYLETKKMLLIK